jgi:hypothetical protein
MIYSLCTIEVPPGKVNDALAAIGASVAADSRHPDAGELRACWYSEIGRLNRILLIVAHESADRMAAANQAMLTGGDPFGVAAIATGITLEAYTPFPGVDFLAPGNHGPFYEVRVYMLKNTGVTPTFAAWFKVLAARTELSPLVSVMYAVDGALPRFIHIWPFRSLNDRMSIREASVKQGIWPPPGGLPHLHNMNSEIYLPAAFSPLK